MYSTGLIWLEGTIGFQENPSHSIEGMHFEMAVIDPDASYSKHGFAVQLTASSIQFATAMEGGWLKVTDKGLKQMHRTGQFFVITHEGTALIVDVWYTDEEGWLVCQYEPPLTDKSRASLGWGVMDREMVAGMLRVTKDQKKITDAMTRRGAADERGFIWLKRSDIVKRLHELYPKESESVPEEKDK